MPMTDDERRELLEQDEALAEDGRCDLCDDYGPTRDDDTRC